LNPHIGILSLVNQRRKTPMTRNEINGLVEQYLSQNKVKVIPQSYLKKHTIPTFGQRQKVRGGMCGPLLG